MRKIPHTLAVVLCISALLAGCNLPFLANSQETASVQTAAAQTVQAQLATAAPATATFTLVPFPTIPPVATTQPPANTQPPATTPTSNCDSAAFVSDVTIPDNTVVNAGDNYTKTWRLKNSGTCSWTPSYAIVFVSGQQMNGPAVQALTGNVNPGQTVDLTVNLTAPSTNGTFTGNWGLRNAAGVIFSHFYVTIVVNSGSGGGAFAVTHVTFTVTGTCPNFHIAVAVTTNGAGTVTYHRVWSDGGTDTSPGTLDFATAGTKTVNYDTYFGTAASSAWMDLYVDTPNHQQFGRANYTCP